MSKLERLGPIKYANYCALSSFVKSIPFDYFEAVGGELFDRQNKLYGGAVELSLNVQPVVIGLGSIADINSDDHELYFKKIMKHYNLETNPNLFVEHDRTLYPYYLQGSIEQCCKFLETYFVDAASYTEYRDLELSLNERLNSYRLNDSESNRIRAFYNFVCYVFSITYLLFKTDTKWRELDKHGDERLNKYLVCFSPNYDTCYIPAIKDLNPTWKQIDLIECF